MELNRQVLELKQMVHRSELGLEHSLKMLTILSERQEGEHQERKALSEKLDAFMTKMFEEQQKLLLVVGDASVNSCARDMAQRVRRRLNSWPTELCNDAMPTPPPQGDDHQAQHPHQALATFDSSSLRAVSHLLATALPGQVLPEIGFSAKLRGNAPVDGVQELVEQLQIWEPLHNSASWN